MLGSTTNIIHSSSSILVLVIIAGNRIDQTGLMAGPVQLADEQQSTLPLSLSTTGRLFQEAIEACGIDSTYF